MTAKRQDITIEQGADFSDEFELPASIVLAGLQAAMQIRADYGYPSPLLTLTIENGGLALDTQARRLRPVIGAATAAAFTPGSYVYDIKTREASGRLTRTHQGRATVSPEVTTFDFTPAPSPSPSPAPSPAPAPAPAPPPDPAIYLTDEFNNFITDENDSLITVTPQPVPIILSPNAYTVEEGTLFGTWLRADTSVTWSIVGGTDAAMFSLAGSVLSLGVMDFESPSDQDGNNVYQVTVRATNLGGNTTDLAISVTVANVIDDTFVDAFTFVDELLGAPSTVYESNTITVSGINVPVPMSIVGGEYSKNGGAYNSAATMVMVGDTVKVRVTSSSDGTPVSTTLTISDQSAAFTVYQLTEPDSISNLTLWLDASDASTITDAGAGAVSQWNDKSGNNNHATQAASGNRPITGTRTLAGKNVLDFVSASNHFMSLASGLFTVPTGAYTMIVVMASDSNANTRRIINASLAGTTVVSLRLQTGNYAYQSRTSLSLTTTTITRNTNPHVLGFRRNGTAITGFYDGVLGTAGSNAQNVTPDAWGIGRDPVATADAFDGVIAEALVYSRSLSDAELNQVGNYLKAKWGITWTGI